MQPHVSTCNSIDNTATSSKEENTWSVKQSEAACKDWLAFERLGVKYSSLFTYFSFVCLLICLFVSFFFILHTFCFILPLFFIFLFFFLLPYCFPLFCFSSLYFFSFLFDIFLSSPGLCFSFPSCHISLIFCSFLLYFFLSYPIVLNATSEKLVKDIIGKFWQFLCLGDKHQACLYTLYPLRDTFLLRFYWIFALWAWKSSGKTSI